LKKEIKTIENLIELLTTIIFTGSVIHSAVNLPQINHYSFVPAFPAILRQPPPTDKVKPPAQLGIQEWGKVESFPNKYQNKWMMQLLPTKDQALQQIFIARLLSTPTDIPIGKCLSDHFRKDPKEVRDIVNNFITSLYYDPNLAKTADAVGYPYLLSDRIAQSVSI